MLVASAQATTSRLQGKARYRKSSQMLLMMPAGRGELNSYISSCRVVLDYSVW